MFLAVLAKSVQCLYKAACRWPRPIKDFQMDRYPSDWIHPEMKLHFKKKLGATLTFVTVGCDRRSLITVYSGKNWPDPARPIRSASRCVTIHRLGGVEVGGSAETAGIDVTW